MLRQPQNARSNQGRTGDRRLDDASPGGAQHLFTGSVGLGLQQLPILETRGVLEPLMDSSRVVFMLGAKPRPEERRNDISFGIPVAGRLLEPRHPASTFSASLILSPCFGEMQSIQPPSTPSDGTASSKIKPLISIGFSLASLSSGSDARAHVRC